MLDQYAVIGNPIAHSKSPTIHATFAQATSQALEYGVLWAPLDGFAAAVDSFRAQGARGLNITAPFKLDAFRYATTLHERARVAGAVNCMRFAGDAVEAENYDGIGLLRDVAQNLNLPVRGRRVLLLGAGGAARGVLAPFLDAGPAELVVANRTKTRAEALHAEFGGLVPCGLDDLAGAGAFDLVLNAASSDADQPVPASVFGSGTLAYDLSYGKGLSPFLRRARNAGVTRLHDGVGMLVEQAAEAFLWWRGVRPATSTVIAALTMPLA